MEILGMVVSSLIVLLIIIGIGRLRKRRYLATRILEFAPGDILVFLETKQRFSLTSVDMQLEQMVITVIDRGSSHITEVVATFDEFDEYFVNVTSIERRAKVINPSLDEVKIEVR